MLLRVGVPILMGLFLGKPLLSQGPGDEFRYHTYAESTAMLHRLADAHPSLGKVNFIGRSATGAWEIGCIGVGNQVNDKTPIPMTGTRMPVFPSVRNTRCRWS